MLLSFKRSLAIICTTLAVLSTTSAQDLSQSSLVPSDARDSAIGAQVSDQIQQFTEGVPQLQQVDRASTLRDTGSRGTFVGADSGDATFFSGETQSRAGTAGSRRTSAATSRRSFQPSRFQSQTAQSRGTSLWPVLTLGFAYHSKPSPYLAENLWDYLHRIPSLRDNDSIRLRVADNVVFLEGTVATLHDREIASQIAALAPGVNRIENRLQVKNTGAVTPDLER